MNVRYAMVLGGLVAGWLSVDSLVGAQDTASPSAPANPSLEEVLTQISKIDQDLAAKTQALRVAIDTASTAKRITESVAQSLRFSLRSAATAGSADLGSALASNRLPMEDSTLMDAIKSLENDWAAAQTQRLTWIKAAAKEADSRVGTVARSAQKPVDLDAAIALTERLQEAIPTRTSAISSALGATNFSSLAASLRSLRRVLEVQSQNDPSALSFALSQFQSAAGSARSAFSENDVQQRIQQALAPFQKAQDEAQEALDRVLATGRGAAEVGAALIKFEEVAERAQQARSNITSRMVRDSSGLANIYRSFAQIVATLEAGQFAQAKSLLGNVRNAGLQALGAVKAASYTQQMSTWEKLIDDGTRKSADKRREEFRVRLAALRTPADLEALAAELSKREIEGRDARDSEMPRGLANQLNVLAAAWASSSPNLLVRQNYGDSVDLRFASEIGTLRKRIERDVLARVLRAPELNQPPLSELAPEVAMEKLGDQFAEKGEWRRLLQLLEANAGQGRFDGSPARDGDLSSAVRAFLAGQNFELAEQWADAVLSYKTVLRAASDRAPVKQAAERLKELNKQHPEAFTAPVPATRGFPPQ
jgi:hypothetical protein